jgi:hypothetical protein
MGFIKCSMLRMNVVKPQQDVDQFNILSMQTPLSTFHCFLLKFSQGLAFKIQRIRAKILPVLPMNTPQQRFD